MKRSIRGQTLLELVVAIGVVGLVASALVAATTGSLRYGQASRMRSQGVKLAQEGVELSRKLRDTSLWDTFLGYATTGGGTWCLDSTGSWTTDAGGGNCPISADGLYYRTVAFDWNDPVMNVTVTVSWGERNSASTVTLRTDLTQWR